MSKIAIGVDVGGSHVSATAIDLNNPGIVKEKIHRIKVDESRTAERILSAWTEVIWAAIDDVDLKNVAGIGLAMPGPFDYENGICWMEQKFKALYGVNVKEELSKRTGIASDKIKFKNDAECYLLGEVFGREKKENEKTIPQAQRYIGVTLGTGFGSAFVFEGQSADANLWCAPFRGEIAEEFMSTRWFVARYKELTGKEVKGAKEIADAAKTIPVEPQAQAIFDEFGQTFSEFMLPLIKEHRAEVIIVGGNIAGAFDLFSSSLIHQAAAINPAIRVESALFGEDSPMVGAASLLKN